MTRTAVTMAVAAALDCMRRNSNKGERALFCDYHRPLQGEAERGHYSERCLIWTGAADTADFTNSLRAGTTAMKSALDAVESGSAETGTGRCL